MNETHNPARASWVESAHGHAEFPIQNLPYCVFRRDEGSASVGVGIGDQILYLVAALELRAFTGLGHVAAAACGGASLNPLMALGRDHWAALRQQISTLLSTDSAAYQADRQLGRRLLIPMADAELLLPAMIGDYTDFYASVHHATKVGSMFRPDNPLLPNYKWIPIGYHGRASSIVESGTRVRRPKGQLKDPNAEAPVFAPSRALDYEMEVGCFVGGGNSLGSPVPIQKGEEHLFGLCLVNDWSARDVQSWEYQPLGPFLSKNFATTISPWVVTLEALEPFRIPRYRASRRRSETSPIPGLSGRPPEGRHRRQPRSLLAYPPDAICRHAAAPSQP